MPQDKKPTEPDALLKTTAEGATELTEEELKAVAGGRKAGKDQQEFLVVKMSDVIITN
jgi:bacteriocin-like protein